MSEPLHTRSLQFHRPRLALGAFYLDECTVRAAVAASSTVPAGTEVQIAGLWPVDHPIEFLHAYFADARANGAAPEVMPGADIEIPDGLRLGDLQLSDVRLRIGPFLHPEGVLLRGSEFIVSGRTVGSVTFDGWDRSRRPGPSASCAGSCATTAARWSAVWRRSSEPPRCRRPRRATRGGRVV